MESASNLIDARIEALKDWRGKMLARVRGLIKTADPEVIEDVKWIKPSNPEGVAVWSHAGIVCTGEIYKDKLKLTFAHGASVADPSGLFNASLDAGTRRRSISSSTAMSMRLPSKHSSRRPSSGTLPIPVPPIRDCRTRLVCPRPCARDKAHR
jgi:hypothetical protein